MHRLSDSLLDFVDVRLETASDRIDIEAGESLPRDPPPKICTINGSLSSPRSKGHRARHYLRQNVELVRQTCSIKTTDLVECLAV